MEEQDFQEIFDKMTKEELIEKKEHYEMMKEQYSKGNRHYLKDFIIKNSEENLVRIEKALIKINNSFIRNSLK